MESFEDRFNAFIPELTDTLSVPDDPQWSVKGFIDYYKNIYTISTDTKVISKIIELMIFPKFLEFAKRYNYEIKLSPHQNYYPDITFIDSDKNRFAIDIKSTYRVSDKNVNGMTLGAFTGYFRNRSSTKNVVFPYDGYKKHFVFGIIYSRSDIASIEQSLKDKGIKVNSSIKKSLISYMNDCTDENWSKFCSQVLKNHNIEFRREEFDSLISNETDVYDINNFTNIKSVIRDFEFFIQEKWRIAICRPGSGNTKNIGSESEIRLLKEGKGLFFREFGEDGQQAFDKYWMHYETKGMAKDSGKDKPLFKDLESFKVWVKTLSDSLT